MSIHNDDAPARFTTKNIPIPVSKILKCADYPSMEHPNNDSISSDTQESPPHVILLDFGNTSEKSYDDLIWGNRDDTSPSKSPSNSAALEGIPHFFCQDYKVTMDHKGYSTRDTSTAPLNIDYSS